MPGARSTWAPWNPADRLASAFPGIMAGSRVRPAGHARVHPYRTRPSPMRHASSLILIASLLPLAAPAQELPRQPEGWTGTGELGLAMARGNSRSESLNTRLRFSREQERWKNGFALSALRSRAEVESDTDGDGIEERRYETSANRYDVSGSSAYRFNPRHHLSANGRYEHDDFSSYDYQGTVAIGLGSRFIDNER